MLKRKKMIGGLLAIALSVSFINTNAVLAASDSVVPQGFNGGGIIGKDKNNIKWSYSIVSTDGGISIWQHDDLNGKVEIPDKVDGHTVIGIEKCGFAGSKKITSVKIPSTVKAIGEEAFFGCTSLSDIEIPASVYQIDEIAFENTPWLTNKRNSNPLVVVNNILIDGRSATGDITIPSNVTTIGDNAFADISLERWSHYRFGNSTSITSVVIPEGVKKIGGFAFYGCNNLSNVTIPSTVTQIGEYAFAGCNFESVNIPNKSAQIGNEAFNKQVNIVHSSTSSGDTSNLSKGWNDRGNNRYYVNSNGELQTGWMDLNGKRYYFYGNGQMAVGFINLGNDSYYYFDSSNGSNMGNLVTGWKKVNGHWYYFNQNSKTGKEKGYMQVGWLYYNGSWYYFYGNGEMATGFINLGGDAYYYLSEGDNSSVGIMKTGWQYINGHWYYFNRYSSEGIVGKMKKGWQYIDGYWYYFYYDDGTMAHDAWIGGYYVNSSGAWV